MNIQVKKTTNLPLVLYGCVTWFLTLRERRNSVVLEKMLLSRLFDSKRGKQREREIDRQTVRGSGTYDESEIFFSSFSVMVGNQQRNRYSDSLDGPGIESR